MKSKHHYIVWIFLAIVLAAYLIVLVSVGEG
jgi:hypothetical protein